MKIPGERGRVKKGVNEREQRESRKRTGPI